MQEVVRCQQQQQQELKNHHHSSNNGGTGNGSGNGTAVTVEEGISSGDEELSVLPRHTKVVVTGNNRTKSVLVGLHGVVKKAVGLGGWHWLVLTNGIEVKLQRNALSVIEAPTGHEDDDANECDNLLSSSSELVTSDDIQKCHKSKLRTHKTVAAVSKTSKHHHTGELHSSNSRSSSHKVLKVDLSKLETTALMRYWKHFNLADVVPNPSKEQLIDIVQSHFMAQQLDELQVISGFVQAAKRLKTVCN